MQVRELINYLVNHCEDMKQEIYVLTEDKTTLVKLSSGNIYVDSEGRVAFIPLDKRHHNSFNSVSIV